MPNKTNANDMERAVAASIVEAGGARAATVNKTIQSWYQEIATATPSTLQAKLIKVVDAFAPKITQMDFIDRMSTYGGGIDGLLDDFKDKDLNYGTGRELSFLNLVPVEDFDDSKFVPTAVTNPLNTVSRIFIAPPKQVSLTIQKALYRLVANNAGNITKFVNSLYTSFNQSFDTYLHNTIIQDYVLATAALATVPGNDVITAQPDKPTKYNDTQSANTKDCLGKIETLISQMCLQATDKFNINGTNTKAFYRSNYDDIKIICTTKFYNDTIKYGMQVGMFRPDLLNSIINRLVVLPPYKLNLPTAVGQSATNAAWTNAIDDNTLIIINSKNSFKYGKQYENHNTQFFGKNEALEITLNYIPYFASLTFGQMLVYTCANLNTKPGNVAGNI